MLGTSSDYVIISATGSAPSSAFTATTLEVNGGTATAYTIDGSEFYYVYGITGDTAGYFVCVTETFMAVSAAAISVVMTVM